MNQPESYGNWLGGPLTTLHQKIQSSLTCGKKNIPHLPLVKRYQSLRCITLQGTNISPKNGILKMIFLFPRWDMLIPWRVIHRDHEKSSSPKASLFWRIKGCHCQSFKESISLVENAMEMKQLMANPIMESGQIIIFHQPRPPFGVKTRVTSL